MVIKKERINKKIYMVSLGCPKNLVDSEVMLALLNTAGYVVCQSADEADLLLVNTCGFIQSAVAEGIDEILTLVQVKQKNPEKIIVVTGCMVQRYKERLQRELPEVDIFIGTESFAQIVIYLNEFERQQQPRIYLSDTLFLMNSTLTRHLATPAHRAYLKVTEGCANYCSYCLIPALRGSLRSRTPADLVRETKQLMVSGVKELTLVAQDLTAYGVDFGTNSPRLIDLLAALLTGCDIPWIRLLYLHPSRVDEKLLDFIEANPRILSYLDIPLQHVSSRLLRLMNRPYSSKGIEDLLALVQAKLPHAAIRTTFIIGFPGETTADVEQLAEFMRCHCLDHVGFFAYSNEEECAASRLPNHCRDEVKQERVSHLMKVQAEISLKKNQTLINSVEPVLIEGKSDETDLLLEGRTWFQAPEIDSKVYITSGICNVGEIVKVRIVEAHPYDLVGEIIETEHSPKRHC